jgi:acetyl esterase
MPLDPDAATVLEGLRRLGGPPVETQSPQDLRRDYRAGRLAMDYPKPPMAEARDLYADEVPIRLYRSHQAFDCAPGVVFFHGGGWVIGDLDTHDILCRQIADAIMGVVVSVGYRLAPEHPFPAAVEDACSATRWVADNAEALGVDASRLAVAGDSAGGNLAAVVALTSRKAGPALTGQVLIYPAVDNEGDYPSYTSRGEGYYLSHAAMEWFRALYLPTPEARSDWRASPLRAEDLAGAPAAYVVTAGFDPLADEGDAYARALKVAGVPVTHRRFDGQMHGFVSTHGQIAAAATVVAEIGEALKSGWR